MLVLLMSPAAARHIVVAAREQSIVARFVANISDLGH